MCTECCVNLDQSIPILRLYTEELSEIIPKKFFDSPISPLYLRELFGVDCRWWRIFVITPGLCLKLIAVRQMSDDIGLSL